MVLLMECDDVDLSCDYQWDARQSLTYTGVLK